MSPFFNKNKGVSALCTYIRKYHPALEDEKLDKRTVYKKIFAPGKYNDSLMRGLMFRLAKLAEDFVSYRAFKDDGTAEINFLLSQLRNRNAQKLFEKKYFEAKKRPQNDSEMSSYHLLKLYEQNSIYFDYLSAKPKSFEELHEIAVRSGDLLLAFFISESKLLFPAMQYTNPNRKLEESGSMLFNIFKSAERGGFVVSGANSSGPMHEMMHEMMSLNYLLVNCILDFGGEETYIKAKEILYKNRKQFSKQELANMYFVLGNFLLTLLNRQDKYNAEYLELMKSMLNDKIYGAYLDVMPITVFENIVNTSLTLGEVDWAEEFALKYMKYLQPSSRENAVNFAKARIAFERGDYDGALKLASAVSFDYHMQKIRLRVLYIKIHFERQEYESVLSTADSFRHLINSSANLGAVRRKNYQLFLKFVRQLVKIRESRIPLNLL